MPASLGAVVFVLAGAERW